MNYYNEIYSKVKDYSRERHIQDLIIIGQNDVYKFFGHVSKI